MLLGTYTDMDVLSQLQYMGQGLHHDVAPKWKEDYKKLLMIEPAGLSRALGSSSCAVQCICLFISTRWRPRWNNELYSRKDLNIVEGMKIRRPRWAGHIIGMEDERMPKKVLMGNSMTQDQWEDQETDGRMLFRGMHYRCYGYDDGGEELKTGRNGGIF